MLSIFKKFVLTTLFALFASQSSAMFIQPDWLDPTNPGVGTNRYSYSFNDPVNLRDPGGNDINDDPRDHSTDPNEYNTARGQEGQSVDEARERARLNAATNDAALELFGTPFDQLTGLRRGAAIAMSAAQNGILGPQAHTVTNASPMDSGAVPNRLGNLASRILPGSSRRPSDPALSGQLSAQEIARGHAFDKHVVQGGEFSGLGIRTRGQFQEHIERVIENPTSTRYYRDGRTAYLDSNSRTVVIRNPTAEGTAFRPDYGIGWDNYVRSLPTRTQPY